MALYPLPIARWTVAAARRCCSLLVIPLTLHEYYLSIGNLVWIAVIGALGLNILVGYTGQVSIGHGAFMSVGAYTAANLANRLDSPWPVNLLAGRPHGRAGGGGRGHPVAAHQGPVPGHRHPGRAAHHRVDHQPRDLHQRRRAGLDRGGPAAAGSDRPRHPARHVLLPAGLRGAGHRGHHEPHADPDRAAPSSPSATRTSRPRSSASTSSATSSWPSRSRRSTPGVTGVLYTYYLGIANYEQFQIGVSIDYLAMIIIGGLGSVLGSIFGAVFVTLLPIVIRLRHGGVRRPVLLASRPCST